MREGKKWRVYDDTCADDEDYRERAAFGLFHGCQSLNGQISRFSLFLLIK
jgi:hypothetical protein